MGPGAVRVGTTSIVNNVLVTVWVGGPGSATCTVKLSAPLPVGVPERTPIELRWSPGGSESPDVSDHVYAPVPPTAARVCE